MLTQIEVILYTTAFCILLPLVIYSFATDTTPPPTSWMGKYYAAEPYLLLAGNLFLLGLLVDIGVRLARHFGLIDAATADTLEPIVSTVFFLLLVIFGFFWFRAWRKVRGAAQAP